MLENIIFIPNNAFICTNIQLFRWSPVGSWLKMDRVKMMHYIIYYREKLLKFKAVIIFLLFHVITQITVIAPYVCHVTIIMLSIIFADHPQVKIRNGNQFSLSAGNDCRQRLCTYSNPRAMASHKLQQAACWKQPLTVHTITVRMHSGTCINIRSLPLFHCSNDRPFSSTSHSR